MTCASEQEVGMTVAIIIPAFNEQETISAVCKANAKFGQLVVIDDGSEDITSKLASDAGAEVVCHKVNLGYDQSIHTGLKWAANAGFKFAITTDADGQIPPEAIGTALSALRKGADVVIGKRNAYQRWSEYIFSFVSRRLWGIYDPLCGLKGYNLSYLKKIHLFYNYDSVGTFFMINMCCLPKTKIKQFDVTTRPRHSRSRFGTSLSAEIKILIAMVYSIRIFMRARKI